MIIEYLPVHLFSLSGWLFVVSFSLCVALVEHILTNKTNSLQEGEVNAWELCRWMQVQIFCASECNRERFIVLVFQHSLLVRVVPQEHSWLSIQVTISLLLWFSLDFSGFLFSPQWESFHPGRVYKKPLILGFAFEIGGIKILDVYPRLNMTHQLSIAEVNPVSWPMYITYWRLFVP